MKSNRPTRENHDDNARSPRISYASAANGAKPNRSEPKTSDVGQEQSENDSLHPILTSILSFVKPYIPQIKSFISQLVSSIFSNGL